MPVASGRPARIPAAVACLAAVGASLLVWGVGLRAHLEHYCFGALSSPAGSTLGEDEGLRPGLSGPVTLRCDYQHSPVAQAADWYPLLWTAAWVTLALFLVVVAVRLARHPRINTPDR